MIQDEKTLDDEVDDLKETVDQLKFDLRQETEERKHQVNDIRIDMGRIRIEKKEWEKLRASEIDMNKLESEINHIIGIRWWKPYISGAFWSNIATPINISISILSLITAGQSALSSWISPSVSTTISISVFMISLVNTFFTPHSKVADSLSQLNDWKLYANQFEKIYYSSSQEDEDIQRRILEYRQLIIELKQYVKESPDKQNLFIDLLYYLVRCFKRVDQWMELSQKEKI